MANRAVPKTTEVIPGAVVNIVLKADQRTGREVRGTVRDVLTRGDHYRGIKVRLADGRIGRVQSIASGASSTPASSSDPDGVTLISTGTGTYTSTPAEDESTDLANRTVQNPRGRRPRYRDMRLDEPLEAPPDQTDLGAYIVSTKRKGKGKGKGKNKNVPNESGQQDDPMRQDGVSGSNNSNSVMDVTSATSTCPVCGTFEGDETAVAHHVAEHFE
ncbi:uncharacterized protein GGS22DRAFT_62753 [Annulohypoxylon maeteangense]|uniref:uncharacterized protein n=1 Tax=Annulohypoxylon maeteangense TaxID=1927788 RepID=UPI0020080CC3|nr:uncharacterized protein GGS22DRAFT_62753 [Annulohypoxylon maeteangense]KAI0888751.1 hypothetical protein GGS22DRAFT_62753 [Annulohypoxylon maeteangense]